MVEIFQAIILGIVEGFTEFLPISSTGHLIVAQDLIGFKDTAELFTVVIQVGAIAAVVWFFRKDLTARIKGILKLERIQLLFLRNLIVATLPAGILALLLDNIVQKLAKPSVVAVALIIGGFILLWVEGNRKQTREAPRNTHHKDEPKLDMITPKQALSVGLAQATALIPGVSRSGASIVGGLLSGLDRVTATAFSFYLSIPIMFSASGYKIAKEHSAISSLPGGSIRLIVGTITAFITALMAVSWLLRYISRNDFKGFAQYRIVFGFFVLLLVATRILR